MSRVRWWMLFLLFFATTVNYLDRAVFSVLAPIILGDLSISKESYGLIMGAFTIFYALGFIILGKLIDKVGTRVGFSISLVIWAAGSALHAAARGPLTLGAFRGILGFGEAGNFPSSIKATAEWFPKKDRAFATALFNSGSNIANVIGPFLFVWAALAYGWRMCFLGTASLDVIWILLWLATYTIPEKNKHINQAELDYIRGDGPDTSQGPPMSWGEVARIKQTWGFVIAKFLTDPVWWFFLFWLPLFFKEQWAQYRGAAGVALGFPFSLIANWDDNYKTAAALAIGYTMATIGSLIAAWFSGHLIRKGWYHTTARKFALALCAACMPIGVMCVFGKSPTIVILLAGVALAGHQGWSANLFTTTSDRFPKRAVASVTGIGSCAGALGGFLFSSVIPGYMIPRVGYVPVFLALGTFHIISLICLHFLMGKAPAAENKPA